MQNLELIKGSRYQRIFPEPYFFEYRNDEASRETKKDIEDYYDNHLAYTQEKLVEELMRYNNTRLRYLLKLYYRQNSEQDIYFIYKSIYRAGNKNYRPEETFLYKTIWTDIKDFFIAFHADFVSTCYLFNRNHKNIDNASRFCEDYFKWLSKVLAGKGKVSFEEVRDKLKNMLKLT
jgi:hypothetical protein